MLVKTKKRTDLPTDELTEERAEQIAKRQVNMAS